MVAESPEFDARGAPRLHTLTGLRFYAALAVYARHVVPALLPIPVLYELSMIGPVGVSFFFVLSGFVLAWSDRKSEKVPSFYFNRFARIYPLHIVSTVFAIIVSGHQISNYWIGTWLTVPLLQGWVPEAYRVGGNGPSWSLSCELFFYLVFPLIYPIICRIRGRRLFMLIATTYLIMIVASILYVVGTLNLKQDISLLSPYTFPPFRVMEFSSGIALAQLVKSSWQTKLTIKSVIALSIAGYAGIAALNKAVSMYVSQLPNGLPAFLVSVLFYPVALLLIGGCAGREFLGDRSVLGSRTHVALGEYSFAFYLLHVPIITLFERMWPNTNSAALLVMITATSIASAALAYQFIERPVERRLRSWWRASSMQSAPLEASR